MKRLTLAALALAAAALPALAAPIPAKMELFCSEEIGPFFVVEIQKKPCPNCVKKASDAVASLGMPILDDEMTKENKFRLEYVESTSPKQLRDETAPQIKKALDKAGFKTTFAMGKDPSLACKI